MYSYTYIELCMYIYIYIYIYTILCRKFGGPRSRSRARRGGVVGQLGGGWVGQLGQQTTSSITTAANLLRARPAPCEMMRPAVARGKRGWRAILMILVINSN